MMAALKVKMTTAARVAPLPLLKRAVLAAREEQAGAQVAAMGRRRRRRKTARRARAMTMRTKQATTIADDGGMVPAGVVAMEVIPAKVDSEPVDENEPKTRVGAAATRAAGREAEVEGQGHRVLMVLPRTNMAVAITEPMSTCSSARTSLRLAWQVLYGLCQNLTRKRSW